MYNIQFTCSSDNGNQYMHGTVFVFLNKSSKSRPGCCAPTFSILSSSCTEKFINESKRWFNNETNYLIPDVSLGDRDRLRLLRLSLDSSSFLSFSRRFSRSVDLRRRRLSLLSSRSISSFLPTSHSRTRRED